MRVNSTALGNEKSAGVDNILAEFLKHGGPSTSDAQPSSVRKYGPMDKARELDTVTDYSSSKKGNTRLYQNYKTISLISHSSKVMLRVILNRLVNHAEQILEEEQAGFRSQKSTTE